MDITQDEMFLGYFVDHDEAHLSLLVSTKLIKIFIKYDKKHSSWTWKIFMWYLSHLFYDCV